MEGFTVAYLAGALSQQAGRDVHRQTDPIWVEAESVVMKVARDFQQVGRTRHVSTYRAERTLAYPVSEKVTVGIPSPLRCHDTLGAAVGSATILYRGEALEHRSFGGQWNRAVYNLSVAHPITIKWRTRGRRSVPDICHERCLLHERTRSSCDGSAYKRRSIFFSDGMTKGRGERSGPHVVGWPPLSKARNETTKSLTGKPRDLPAASSVPARNDCINSRS